MLEPGRRGGRLHRLHGAPRDHWHPSGGAPDENTLNIRLEYALVITFLYGQSYTVRVLQILQKRR